MTSMFVCLYVRLSLCLSVCLYLFVSLVCGCVLSLAQTDDFSWLEVRTQLTAQGQTRIGDAYRLLRGFIAKAKAEGVFGSFGSRERACVRVVYPPMLVAACLEGESDEREVRQRQRR